jgi:hypothetical protein
MSSDAELDPVTKRAKFSTTAIAAPKASMTPSTAGVSRIDQIPRDVWGTIAAFSSPLDSLNLLYISQFFLKLAAIIALPSERFLSKNTRYIPALAKFETPLTVQANVALRALARHHFLSKEIHLECRSSHDIIMLVLANRSTKVGVLLNAFAKKLHPEAVFDDLRFISRDYGSLVRPLDPEEILFERGIQDEDTFDVMLVNTYTHARTYTCTYSLSQSHLHKLGPSCTATITQICTREHARTYIHTYIKTHTSRIHTYTHAHIYNCTHTGKHSHNYVPRRKRVTSVSSAITWVPPVARSWVLKCVFLFFGASFMVPIFDAFVSFRA